MRSHDGKIERLRGELDIVLSNKSGIQGSEIQNKVLQEQNKKLTRTNQRQSETIGKQALELQGDGAQVTRGGESRTTAEATAEATALRLSFQTAIPFQMAYDGP